METLQDSLDQLADRVANSIDARPEQKQPESGRHKLVEQRMRPKMELENYKRQDAYIAVRKAMGGVPNIVAIDAFIRGMRDLGYKDPAWAMAELIDNSVQAGARRVGIRLAFEPENKSQAKNPSEIAIIDDGVGMKPEMLTYAVEWGGTDREDNRSGFGRFGYGLPSSCVSIARRYSVYSKVAGGDWYAVTVDIGDIVSARNDIAAIAKLLAPKRREPPKWLSEKSEDGMEVDALKSGTVIVLEDLDRLRRMTGWIIVKSLVDRLKKRFGLIYRHWLPDVKIFVDGAPVDAIDPLFLLDYGRFVDETRVRAKKVVERAFEVTTDEGKKGVVRIRAALLPWNFSWVNPDDPNSEQPKNQRWKQVLGSAQYLNGLLICREGRQIDVIQPDWGRFQNYDAYIKVEINFDPVLDEYFNITTAKQQIRIDEAMWDRLHAPAPNGGGLRALINDMRREWHEGKNEIEAFCATAAKEKTEELPAATAMLEAERFRTKKPRISDKAEADAEQNLDEAASSRAKATGIPVEQVRERLKKEAEKRPWDIEYQAMDEGPFFVPKRLGDQKKIIVNTAHAFYSRLYEPASPDTKAALEVLLFVLADGEINAEDERADFYRNERIYHWSPMLQHALMALVHQTKIEDQISMHMEQSEMSAETR